MKLLIYITKTLAEKLPLNRFFVVESTVFQGFMNI